MSQSTRNILLTIVVVMILGMSYGYMVGTTPDYRAMLGTIYATAGGLATSLAFLVLLPARELARRHKTVDK